MNNKTDDHRAIVYQKANIEKVMGCFLIDSDNLSPSATMLKADSYTVQTQQNTSGLSN